MCHQTFLTQAVKKTSPSPFESWFMNNSRCKRNSCHVLAACTWRCQTFMATCVLIFLPPLPQHQQGGVSHLHRSSNPFVLGIWYGNLLLRMSRRAKDLANLTFQRKWLTLRWKSCKCWIPIPSQNLCHHLHQWPPTYLQRQHTQKRPWVRPPRRRRMLQQAQRSLKGTSRSATAHVEEIWYPKQLKLRNLNRKIQMNCRFWIPAVHQMV